MPASRPPRVENGSASIALPAHAQLRRCHVPHAQMHREGSDQPRKPRCGWIWRTNTCISKRESVISPANSPSSNTHGKFIEPPPPPPPPPLRPQKKHQQRTSDIMKRWSRRPTNIKIWFVPWHPLTCLGEPQRLKFASIVWAPRATATAKRLNGTHTITW